MKRIFIYIFILVCFNMYAPTPHPVDIEVAYEGGVYPDTLIFQAWRTVNPENILDNESPDCFYPTGTTTWYLQIQCGSFTDWDAGDILHVEVFDPNTSEGGSGDYELTYDNFQLFHIGEGGIVLDYVPPLSFNIPESFHIDEDDILEIFFGQYIVSLFGDDVSLSHSGNTEIVVDIEGLDVEFTAPENWNGSELVTFTAHDEHSNVINDQVNVVFDAVNDPPAFDIPVPSFTLNEDDSLWVNFSSFYSDVDNYDLELVCSGNNNIEVEIDNGEVTFIPAANWNGSEIITFMVSDGVTRETVSDEVEVIVNPINDPPVLDLPEDITFLYGNDYIIDLSELIWDADGDDMEISVSGNEQINPVFDDLVVTFEVPDQWHGSETMVFFANDNQRRAVASDTVTVNILTIEDTYLELPVLVIEDGESLSVSLQISYIFEEWSVNSFDLNIEYDPYVLMLQDYSQDNTIITNGSVQVQEDIPGMIQISYFHYLPLIGGGDLLHLDFASVCFGESPLDIQNAVFNEETIENINDGYVTVTNIGLEHPPVAHAGMDVTIEELSTIELDGSTSFDPDGDPITYLWSGPPEILFDDETSATPVVTAPDVTEDTEFMISLVCSDENLNSLPDMLIITVVYVNHAPAIELPENFTLDEDSTLVVDFEPYITDIDSDELILEAEGNTDIFIDIDGLSVSISSQDNWYGNEFVTFIIDDQIMRLTDSDEVEIIVQSVNDVPIADAGENQSVHDGGIVTLDASGSYDIEEDDLTFMWLAPGGIVLSDPYAVDPTFTAPQTTDPEDLVFTLQVSDDQNRETDSDEVTITVFDDEPSLPRVALLPGHEAKFTWLAPGTGGSGEELEQGFEGPAIPQGWSNIDNDGDGYSWYINTEEPHSGSNCAASASFLNNDALTPDNWLITPQIELGGLSRLDYWVSAADEYHPLENYSVLLSNSTPELENFSRVLYSETLNNDQWHQVDIPLAEFGGQSVYLAFVHHNCTDQLLLKLDDVRVFNGSEGIRNRELNGYNVYLDDELQGFTEDREYTFSEIYETHTAGVQAVYDDMNSDIISVDFDPAPSTNENIPLFTGLKDVYPNPFNPSLHIFFDLSQETSVSLSIYNFKGQNVGRLINEVMPAGSHQTCWSPEKATSGIYFVSLKTDSKQELKKVILMK